MARRSDALPNTRRSSSATCGAPSPRCACPLATQWFATDANWITRGSSEGDAMIARRLICALGVLFIPAVPAAAYCSKPSAPYCAERYGRFTDENDFDRCRREMESFKLDMESFISCTRRE